MSGAFLVLVRIHPRAYFCTVVMGHLAFNTANESQKLMLRGPRSFIFSSFKYCISCCSVLRILYGSTSSINNVSLSPFTPENLISRDGFGHPVPRQPDSSPHSG